jgi:hypothetical protein
VIFYIGVNPTNADRSASRENCGTSYSSPPTA